MARGGNKTIFGAWGQRKARQLGKYNSRRRKRPAL
jgi:hypothetical protein